jgi:hypothetical protein
MISLAKLQVHFSLVPPDFPSIDISGARRRNWPTEYLKETGGSVVRAGRMANVFVNT